MLNDIIEFLTSKEMIIVGAIAGAGILLTLFVYIMEKTKDKRKQRHNTKEIKNLALKITKEENKALKSNKKEVVVPAIEKEVEVKPVVEQPTPVVAVQPKVEEKPVVIPIEELEPVKEEEPFIEVLEDIEEPKAVIEHIEEKKEEELVYTTIEPNEEEAREELRRATENLLRKASEEALEEEMNLNKFEAEQEKNAIISIDEYLQKGSLLYNRNEKTQYEDEGNEPISLADLERQMNAVEIIEEVQEQKTEIPVIEKAPVVEEQPTIRFKSSPIISPIFGIENTTPTDNDMELENTANFDKFDAERRRTNEFVTTLKELQKKL